MKMICFITKGYSTDFDIVVMQTFLCRPMVEQIVF